MRLRTLTVVSLSVSFLSVLVAGCGGSEHQLGTKSSALAATPMGAVQLDAAAYRAPGTVSITVLDSDVTNAPVNVASTTDPKGINLNLQQKPGADPGTFYGTIDLVLVASKGKLLVTNGDTITVTYHDADDGTAHAITVTATARVDNVSPDLIEASASYATDPVPAGGTIAVTDTVTLDPRGSASAGGFYVYFFLSQSGTLSQGANTQIGSRYVSGLAPGQLSAATTQVTLPLNVNGPYYILAYANPWGYVAETDGIGWPNGPLDPNNTAAGPQITVGSP